MTKLILVLLCSLSVLYSRSDILTEDEVKDKKGNSFYLLTICKEGWQYSAISDLQYNIKSMAQDFEYDVDIKRLVGIRCQLDIKTEKQLEEINKDWYNK